jgi:4-amino-4-deoxy-L-arabinose transferase-like glycosyltransferase
VTADGAVMSESLFGLLVAAILLLAYALRERSTWLRALGLGALVGVAALTRGEGLLLLALVALPLTVRRPAHAALACAACALVLVPWAVRNESVFHRFVPISNNDGTLAAGANCGATYHGEGLGAWRLACIPRHGGSNEAADATVYRDAGTDYAAHHLGRLPVVLAARAGRTLGVFHFGWESRNSEGRGRVAMAAGMVAFFLLVPVGVAGAMTLRRRREPLWLLAAPVAITLVITVFGYGTPRFREPAEIVLVVLAAVAIDAGLRARGAAQRGDETPAGVEGGESATASPRAGSGARPTSRLSASTGRSSP